MNRPYNSVPSSEEGKLTIKSYQNHKITIYHLRKQRKSVKIYLAWGRSSVGRAFGSHPKGQEFDSLRLHHGSLFFGQASVFLYIEFIGESNSIVHVRRFAAGGGARTYNRIFAKQMKKACLFRLSPSPPEKSTLLRAFFNEINPLRDL